MSRRRPAQGKHLERDRVVADQVAQVLDSRGKCPGPCNAAYRRQREQFEREAYVQFDRLTERHPDATAGYVMQLATQRVRASWEAEGRAAWPAREGTPVWCLRCTADIAAALDRLPRLLQATLDLGSSPPARPDGSLVTDPVLVLATSDQDDQGRVVDVLACGHRRTRRASIGPVPRRVVCPTCLAVASVPEPGRLAPAEKLGRSSGRAPVSPAGSPAWVEVDAAVQWVCSTADQVRYLLDRAREERFPWRTGSTADRVAAASSAARFLVGRLGDVLALPDPLPESIGRQARGLASRLAEISGTSTKPFPLKEDCPRCGRRGLVREDGASMVHCRSCTAWFGEDDLQERLDDLVREGVRR